MKVKSKSSSEAAKKEKHKTRIPESKYDTQAVSGSGQVHMKSGVMGIKLRKD